MEVFRLFLANRIDNFWGARCGWTTSVEETYVSLFLIQNADKFFIFCDLYRKDGTLKDNCIGGRFCVLKNPYPSPNIIFLRDIFPWCTLFCFIFSCCERFTSALRLYGWRFVSFWRNPKNDRAKSELLSPQKGRTTWIVLPFDSWDWRGIGMDYARVILWTRSRLLKTLRFFRSCHLG